jgi:hypothetical protein
VSRMLNIGVTSGILDHGARSRPWIDSPAL